MATTNIGSTEYMELIKRAPVGIYTLDKNGIIDSFNPKMVEIAGAKSAKQVIGLNALTLPSYKRAGLDTYFKKGLRGQPFDVETEYVSYTGKKKTWRHYRGVPIFGADNKTVERLLLIVEDVSERKWAEDALKKSESRLKGILACMNDMVFVFDKEGRFTFYHAPKGSKLYAPPEKFLGAHFSEVLPPHVSKQFKKSLAVAKKRESSTFDFPFQEGSDDTWYSASVAPVMENGGFGGVVVTVRDITDRRQLEAKLEAYATNLENEVFERTNKLSESEAKYRSYTEKSVDGVFIMQDNGKFLEVNPAGCRMLGYTEEELKRRSVRDFITDTGDGQKIGLDFLINVIKRGEYGAEVMLRRKDGEIITTDVRAAALGRNRNLGLIRDVTFRKRIEDRNRELASLNEINPDVLFECDAQGKTFYKNRAAQEAEQKGIKFTTQGGKLLDAFWAPIRDSKAGELLEHEIHVFSDEGERIFLISATYSDDRQRVLVLMHDYTERARAEEKIRNLDKLKSRFITALTHVTRTPLNEMRWNLEMLLSGEFAPVTEEQKKFIRHALGTQENILRIITNMNLALDIERNTFVLEKAPTSILSLVSSVVDGRKEQCLKNEITCKVLAPEVEPPSVTIDTEKIRHVINILLENAIGYSKKGGSVSVSFVNKEGGVHVQIKDTGIGVPKQEQAHVFERFFRASNAMTMYPDGVGLGLYIAKAIVEAHGGQMGFTSTEGKGSVFWFAVPMESP